MNNEGSRQPREIVMPGDLLEGDKLKPGAGTYVSDGKIYAALLGSGIL